MKIGASILGVIAILLGGLWIAQGSNMLAGSAMSGQSMWLWIGVVVLVAGGWPTRWRRR